MLPVQETDRPTGKYIQYDAGGDYGGLHRAIPFKLRSTAQDYSPAEAVAGGWEGGGGGERGAQRLLLSLIVCANVLANVSYKKKSMLPKSKFPFKWSRKYIRSSLLGIPKHF